MSSINTQNPKSPPSKRKKVNSNEDLNQDIEDMDIDINALAEPDNRCKAQKKITIMDDRMKFNDRLLRHIRKGNDTEVELFLKDVDPCDLVDKSGCTLLHIVARYPSEDESVLKYLIGRGCNVDAVDNRGNTPLILAARYFRRNNAEELLEANAGKVLVKNDRLECAAELLIDTQWISRRILKPLLTRLKEECSNDSVLTAKKLLEWDCSIIQAVFLKDPIVLEYMLRNGCSVDESDDEEDDDEDGLTALHFAVGFSDLASVKLLIEYGADVNAHSDHGLWPINYVRSDSKDDVKILNFLLEHKASLFDDDGNLIVRGLFHRGNKDIVRSLMRYKLDFNKKDSRGLTLFYYLTINDFYDPVEEIKDVFEEHFDINLKSNGKSALITAAHNCNSSTVEFLLMNGAEVNDTAGRENQAIYYVFFGHLEERRQYLTINDRLKCIEILLQYGTDIQYVKSDQSTIFDYVMKTKIFVFVKPILAHLALMEALGCEIKELIRRKINSHVMFRSYFALCQRKIEKSRRNEICRSVTLFQFLTESEEKLIKFARNEHFASRLKFIMYSKRRSKLYYENIFRKRAVTVMNAANLHNKAIETLSRIMELNNNKLILEKIVNYLHCKDLQNVSRV